MIIMRKKRVPPSDSNRKGESLNIIIAGKSGAGKSSFLNYLIGENHFKVGEGMPVTQDYFEEFTYIVPDTGVHYKLYDTKGIEPDTTEECKTQILKKIRSCDQLGPFEWIHTVYYCFPANASRIEKFEIQFIKTLMKSVSIVILLSKKDLVAPEKINALIEQLEKELDNSIQIIPVCSVHAKTRKGTSSVPEGKEKVLRASFLGLWEKLAQTHPKIQLDSFLEPKPYQIYKKNNPIPNPSIPKKISFTLDFLCSYLCLDDFIRDKDVVVRFMNKTNKYIGSIIHIINNLDIEKIWNNNDSIHREVFAFYQKVNKTKPRVLYSNRAKEALLAIKNYHSDNLLEKLEQYTMDIGPLFDKVKRCVFWDAKERLELTNCFNHYRDLVRKFGIELNLLVNNFILAYQTELNQYGQYCLKKELKKEDCQALSSESDMDSTEKIYFDVVRACLKDKQIDPKERTVLEKLVDILEIPHLRAGRIEEFATDIIRQNKKQS